MYSTEYKSIEELENSHFWYRAMEENIIELVRKYVSGKIAILDAGCGTGGLSEKLSVFGDVTAIDINDKALKFANSKKIYRVFKASVENLPFSDNKFDLVLCLDVLYHKKVKNDRKAVHEMKRVLKTGGRLFIRLPAFECLRGAHDIVVQTRHRYTVPEVRKILDNNGLKVIKLSYANLILSIPLTVKRSMERIRKIQHLTSDTALPPALINTIFYHILKNENKLLNFVSFPFGSSVFCIAEKS